MKSAASSMDCRAQGELVCSQTWVLMLLGFGGLGAMLRRRRLLLLAI